MRCPTRLPKALVAVTFLLATAAASSETVAVTGAEQPGSVLQVTIPSPPWVDAIEVLLTENGRIVAETWAFSRDEWDSWIALLGVPSWLDPGSYEVHAYLYSNLHDDVGLSRIIRRSSTVEISPRIFRRERIPLTSTLSVIRQDDSDERRHQTMTLSEILLTTNSDAIFALREFTRPVDSTRKTSEFGDQRTFVYSDGNEAGSIHHGIDFAAPRGTPVVASATGRVAMAEYRIVTGNTVAIEHLPGVYSLYYHLDSLSVVQDSMVRSGQSIGTVGSTGLSTGPHLHWELRVSGVPVDPEPYLSIPVLDFRGDSSKLGDH